MNELSQSGADWLSKLKQLKQKLEDENRALSKVIVAHDGILPEIMKFTTPENIDQKTYEPGNEN